MRALNPTHLSCFGAMLLLSLLAVPTPAMGELLIDKLIVELRQGKVNRQDLTVWNKSPDRVYILVEPSLITNPGKSTQRRVNSVDPREIGLLASPQRMILEPGQQRLLRIASLTTDASLERVYRVTVRPVVNEDAADGGLELLVGYDLLVLARPAITDFSVTTLRQGQQLTLRNEGNSSVELLKIRQCDRSGHCSDQTGKRLYAGAEWQTQLNSHGPAELFFSTADGPKTKTVK
ncbi:fimbria/pilus periplasmic chaperone [Sphingomicrobium lutaoense]|uniref:P pilus assembly chaperone PapD n=1 Tax=Sphingomicrobium lutaoense TaxID=515949 RepID=A0A839YWP2_9SPHN|nr:fimbria/pilus periplasmic chaperone [Sphingomicrobium lutaoense]MBB3763456.1 P pilus assembly chaperone PapD [Sphingomicrobium lutaoense]